MKTQHNFEKEVKNNMEICSQSLKNLNNIQNLKAPSPSLLFESFTKLLSYEGINSIYEGMRSVYTDLEKITQAFHGIMQVLTDVYEIIPEHCIYAWQAKLKQLCTRAIDESINTFAQQYLNTFPSKSYGFLKQKAQTNLESCHQALKDLKKAHVVAPSLLFEFFTCLLTVGMRFFECLNDLLQPLVEKQNNLHVDKLDVATAA